MPKVADLFAQLGLRTDKASFKQGDRLLGAIKGAVIGLLAFKTVKFFGGLINDTRKEADELAKMSKKVGISVEALQQLEFAAGISGSNLQQLRTGLQRFARTASDSQRGSKMAVDVLKDLGVEAEDAQGNLRPLDAMLMDVADRFAAMPDGTKKTALAMEAFGRSGAELIPFLNEGSEGIGALREEFVELGAQISGPMAAQFEQLNDDELRVRTALKGIRNEVVIALLPTLKEMVKGLLAWIKANRELIRQKLQVILKQLVSLLKFFAKAVAFAVENWRLLLVLLVSAKVFGLIGKLIVLYSLLGKEAFLSGLKAAAGWVAATLPLILLGALIAAAILLILDFFDVFGDGDGILESLRQKMIDTFVGWIDSAVRNWKVFFSWIKDKAREAAEFAADVWDFAFGAIDAEDLVKRQKAFQDKLSAEATRIGNVATTKSVNATSTVNITVPEGADPERIAGATRKAMEGFWNGKIREAEASTEQ